jgi:hypothetical protein
MNTTPPLPSQDPTVIPPSQSKDPILLLILALFLGGIAYFVLGQWQKGLAAVALWFAGVVFAVLTCGIGIGERSVAPILAPLAGMGHAAGHEAPADSRAHAQAPGTARAPRLDLAGAVPA